MFAKPSGISPLLRKENIPVTDVIINRVERHHGSCPFCGARVEMQRPWLKELAKSFKGLDLHHVPLLPEEIQGLSRVEGIRRACVGTCDS